MGASVPILNAGMAPLIAGPALAAAVAAQGGAGVLGIGGVSPARAREAVAACRRQGSGPIGVNIALPITRRETVTASLDAGVDFLVTFWGDERPYVAMASTAGIPLFAQVGTVDGARAAFAAGAAASAADDALRRSFGAAPVRCRSVRVFLRRPKLMRATTTSMSWSRQPAAIPRSLHVSRLDGRMLRTG